jgi:uncharacterized membrane protein YdfJ with MMPL/SSD domain
MRNSESGTPSQMLLDSTIVRGVLLPAAMALVGDWS